MLNSIFVRVHVRKVGLAISGYLVKGLGKGKGGDKVWRVKEEASIQHDVLSTNHSVHI